jgi:DNA-binding transcriptional regulator GbsR (MarR family)
MDKASIISEAKMRLIETGGRTSQDLGVGRILGQVLVHLYLQETECSLDTIGEELGLSKASVSIAVRQLEKLGLARKVWKKGDRRNYFKSADNIGTALQQGLLSFFRQKLQGFGDELDSVTELLAEAEPSEASNNELEASNNELDFLQKRVNRARKLQRRLDRVIGNPLIKLLSSGKKNL